MTKVKKNWRSIFVKGWWKIKTIEAFLNNKIE